MECHSYEAHVEYYLKNHLGNKITTGKIETCLICYSPKTSTPGNSKLRIKFSKTESSTLNFIYYPKTSIQTISPLFGKLSGGTTVQIFGRHFRNYTGWLQCSFGSSFVKAQFISNKKVICRFVNLFFFLSLFTFFS